MHGRCWRYHRRSKGSTARELVQRGLSVRETEQLVARQLKGDSARASAPARDPDVLRLERDLRESLGAKVELKTRRGGKGSVVIHYTSLDELDGILSRLKP